MCALSPTSDSSEQCAKEHAPNSHAPDGLAERHRPGRIESDSRVVSQIPIEIRSIAESREQADWVNRSTPRITPARHGEQGHRCLVGVDLQEPALVRQVTPVPHVHQQRGGGFEPGRFISASRCRNRHVTVQSVKEQALVPAVQFGVRVQDLGRKRGTERIVHPLARDSRRAQARAGSAGLRTLADGHDVAAGVLQHPPRLALRCAVEQRQQLIDPGRAITRPPDVFPREQRDLQLTIAVAVRLREVVNDLLHAADAVVVQVLVAQSVRGGCAVSSRGAGRTDEGPLAEAAAGGVPGGGSSARGPCQGQ